MARTKSDIISEGRRLNDLGLAFAEAIWEAGGNDSDIRRLLGDKMAMSRHGQLAMGKLKLDLSPCQRLVPHLIPDWVTEVVEDVEPTLTEGSKLSFPSFLRESDGGRTDGKTMRSRAEEMKANYGLSDVPALLGKDGKGLTTIPVELRGEVYIVLTATVLRRSDGDLCVPFLFWDGGAWVVCFDRRGGGWGGGGRLVSCE